jgi:hypothetical protein
MNVLQLAKKRPGDPIRADEWNAIVEYIRAIDIQADRLRVVRDGPRFNLLGPRPGGVMRLIEVAVKQTGGAQAVEAPPAPASWTYKCVAWSPTADVGADTAIATDVPGPTGWRREVNFLLAARDGAWGLLDLLHVAPGETEPTPRLVVLPDEVPGGATCT